MDEYKKRYEIGAGTAKESFDDIMGKLDEILADSSKKTPAKPTPVSSLPTSQVRPPGPRSPPSVWRDIGMLGFKIGVIIFTFVLVFTFFYGFVRNTEPGMAPMVKDGDLVMFYRLDKDYAVGDLLLLRYKENTEVRRVVAKAGDTVDITDQGLVVNGSLQQEPDITQKTERYADGVSFPLTVGSGQVFVLGDARAGATDSRVYGPVSTKDTLGTVITVIRRRNF